MTEIYLCGVCSCQEVLRRNGRAQARAQDHAQIVEEQLDADLGDHDAQRSRRQLAMAAEERERLQGELAEAQASASQLRQDAVSVAARSARPSSPTPFLDR
eukprot:COSAG01_NODE_12773_length_1688_cov_1.181246_3_plen_101_part_00